MDASYVGSEIRQYVDHAGSQLIMKDIHINTYTYIGLNISRRFHLAPKLAVTAEVHAMLQNARLLRRLAFPALRGLPRKAFRTVVSAVFYFKKNTARLLSMKSLAESHVTHRIFQDIARIL